MEIFHTTKQLVNKFNSEKKRINNQVKSAIKKTKSMNQLQEKILKIHYGYLILQENLGVTKKIEIGFI